ncbi:hypothetical protein CRG98_028233 [Punica granatum]|uniref:Uncharacterized protein n=1 Tax=Punica granatum TaxID=22663 RepID=A0A2I0J559_PUNGR|nr:hypothetical protein CRG98_028233 [Punica granatum]
MEEFTPGRFLCAARWNPGGPMAFGCSAIVGLPLISHLGCTLLFPSRVIRQLGDLQDIPADADRSAYQLTWAEVSPSATGRFIRVREVQRMWETRLTQDLYFLEFPTDEDAPGSSSTSISHLAGRELHTSGRVHGTVNHRGGVRSTPLRASRHLSRAHKSEGATAGTSSGMRTRGELEQKDSTLERHIGPSTGQDAEGLPSVGLVR